MKKKDSSKLIWCAVSVTLFLLVWQAVAMTSGGSIVMARPAAVFRKLIEKIADGTLWDLPLDLHVLSQLHSLWDGMVRSEICLLHGYSL